MDLHHPHPHRPAHSLPPISAADGRRLESCSDDCTAGQAVAFVVGILLALIVTYCLGYSFIRPGTTTAPYEDAFKCLGQGSSAVMDGANTNVVTSVALGGGAIELILGTTLVEGANSDWHIR